MTMETTRVISSGPLYDGGLRIVMRGDLDRHNDNVWFCVSGILNICDDGSAIITLNGNYDNWYELVDTGAITRDSHTGILSFITKDNVTFALREPNEDDLARLEEDGYDSHGFPTDPDEVDINE